MIVQTKTLDGRMISLTDLEMIFTGICDAIRSTDVEFHWKDPICYETVYMSTDQMNDIMSAIVFYVGGTCDVYMWQQHGVMNVSVTNPGYYANIGA